MTPLKRSSPNKSKSSRSFSKKAGTTKAANTAQPMRGGWRL